MSEHLDTPEIPFEDLDFDQAVFVMFEVAAKAGQSLQEFPESELEDKYKSMYRRGLLDNGIQNATGLMVELRKYYNFKMNEVLNAM